MKMANMPRRRIGQTLLTVPPFGFGAAHLGNLYFSMPEAQSQATLEAAWTAGVRLYDTAPWYGRGLSEHRLGSFLRNMPRGEFQVSTKVGRTLHRPKDPARFDRSPWLGGLNFEVRYDYSYDGIMRSYEQSLQRMSLDTVDVLLIHDLDRTEHGDTQARYEKQLETSGLKALQELKAAGDIKAIGMGINDNDGLQNVASRFDVDFCLVAMPYTMLDHASLHRGMAGLQTRGISAIIGTPFASGILATGSNGEARYRYATASPEIQAKVRGIEAVCEAYGVALPAAAMQFVLAHPIVSAIIPGAARPEEVMQNVASVAAPIPSAYWRDLKAQGLILPDAPVPTIE